MNATAITVLTIVLLAPIPFVRAEDQIPVAESAAKAGAASPEGKKFQEGVGQAFGRDHSATIQQCAKQATRRDIVNFDLFLRIGGSGVVQLALVRPANALSTCVQAKMDGWKTLTPPAADFWVKVGVNLKGKS